MKKVTIQDIARELNLSRNTVSKALRNSEQVSYETKCMVIKRPARWDTLNYLLLF